MENEARRGGEDAWVQIEKATRIAPDGPHEQVAQSSVLLCGFLLAGGRIVVLLLARRVLLFVCRILGSFGPLARRLFFVLLSFLLRLLFRFCHGRRRGIGGLRSCAARR